jgi:hypothetical protein
MEEFLILVDFVVSEKTSHFDEETGVFEPKFPVKNADSGCCAPLLGQNHKFH